MTIEKFKKTQDFIDISYMIDHVKLISTRLDVLQQLGYTIGVNIVVNDLGVKTVTKGKKGEIRMQVTPKESHANIAKCVIIKN